MTSMRRNDVASTSFRRHVPNMFLINQCQIITFLILKYDITENSRIELRGIVFPVQVDALLGGQRVCWPPLSNYWGGLAPPGPPSSYAYEVGIFQDMLVQTARAPWSHHCLYTCFSAYVVPQSLPSLEYSSSCSRPSVARRLMARLQRLFRTRS